MSRDMARTRLPLLVAAALTVLAGCDAYKVGNPFLPKARLLATTDTKIVTVKLTPGASLLGSPTYKVEINPDTVNFSVGPFANDTTPGVRLNSYTVSWFDVNGSPVDTALIPSRVQGISLYIPAGKATGSGSAGSGSTVSSAGGNTITVPVATKPLETYGISNGFIIDPGSGIPIQRTDGWSQLLTGRVTFAGRDDDGYPVTDLYSEFTLKFETTAANASGSVSN